MSAVRGRVWSTPWRRKRRLWSYEVTVGGVVIDADNTADFALIVAACDKSARAADLLARVGHTFRPYAELVDEASP